MLEEEKMTFSELFYRWFSDDKELSKKFNAIYSANRDYCAVTAENGRIEYAYAGTFDAYVKLIIDDKTHYLDNTAGLWIHGVGMLLPTDPDFFKKAKDILSNYSVPESKIVPISTYIFAPYIPLQIPKP